MRNSSADENCMRMGMREVMDFGQTEARGWAVLLLLLIGAGDGEVGHVWWGIVF